MGISLKHLELSMLLTIIPLLWLYSAGVGISLTCTSRDGEFYILLSKGTPDNTVEQVWLLPYTLQAHLLPTKKHASKVKPSTHPCYSAQNKTCYPVQKPSCFWDCLNFRAEEVTVSWHHKSIILAPKKIQEKIPWSEDSPFLPQDTSLKQCRHNPGLFHSTWESGGSPLSSIEPHHLSGQPSQIQTAEHWWLPKEAERLEIEIGKLLYSWAHFFVYVNLKILLVFFHSDHFVDPEVKCSHT